MSEQSRLVGSRYSFMRQVVRAAGERLSEEVRTAAEPFCGPKPDIDWQDPATRKAHLADLVAAGLAMLVEAAGIDDPEVAEPADLLAQVIDQDVTGDEAGNPQIRQGVARDRVISHSDPDMRHGRKSASRRFDGHKLDVIGDEDPELSGTRTLAPTSRSRPPTRSWPRSPATASASRRSWTRRSRGGYVPNYQLGDTRSRLKYSRSVPGG